LNKTIGSGTFGKVRLYHYRDENVAVKECSKNPKGHTVTKLEKCVITEANMMLSFKPHPNIVNVFGLMKTTDKLRDSKSPRLSLVTEHVNGRSLWTLINLKARVRRTLGMRIL